MADVMYDPQDKPLAAKVTRGNLAVNKPERVTVTGYEAGVNGTGQPVLKLVCYPVGQPSFQEAIQITTDHLAPLMTGEQYDALEKQSMNSCDIDIELVKVAGFSLNPYRISKVLRGEIVAKKQEDKVEKARELAGELAEIDKFLKDAPPADDKPTCLNEWALDPKKLAAYQERIEYIASEAGVGMKEARGWGLTWFNAPDETQIPMSASDALKFVKAKLPTSIDEQVEAAQESSAKPEPSPEPDDLTPPPDVLKDVPEVKHAETVNPLAGITTLTGIPVAQIAARLDEKYPIKAYKPIRMSGGRAGTDIAQDYVRDRIDEVFGPQGIGWKFDIHPILGAIVPEAIPDSKGGQTWNVTLLAHVFKYRIAINGQFEWVELSPMSDNDTNADKGYAFRGAFTSLLKQVVRSLGGFNHLYRNEKLADWAREQLGKRS